MKKRISNAFGKDVYLLGSDSDNTLYWLVAPSWDCNWYWGFGYVSTYTNNKNPNKAKDSTSHQHIDSSFLGQQGSEYVHNLYDSPKLTNKTFTSAEGWELGELFKQFYFLNRAAGNFGRGKCHIADTNIDLWQDVAKQTEINDIIIPKVTARILQILTPLTV